MEIGIIDEKYQNKTYFNWPNQGVIGLTPTSQDEANKDKLKR